MGVVHRFAWLVGLGVAGCFAPQPAPGAPCSAEGTCPTGLTCVANVCAIPGAADAGDPDSFGDARSDASIDAIVDAPLDAPPQLPTLVQQVKVSAQAVKTLTATFASAPTAGHTIVMVGGCPTNSLATVSGGAASWQHLAFSTVYANVETYAGVSDGTSSVTVALPTCNQQMSISLSEWAHVGPTPVEPPRATNGTAGPTTAGTLSIGAPRLLLFSVSTFAPNTFGTPGVGWTPLDAIVDSVDLRSWYQVVTSPGNTAPSVSLVGSQWDALLVALPGT